eukprot:10486874-Karenia_brevis.AAC.1
MSFLAHQLCQPGPPLHIGIGYIPLPSDRAALASFVCGDWFLGKFACNWFAKNLLPRSDQVEAATDPARICLSCWHSRRTVFFEDENHVLWTCPDNAKARCDFAASVSPSLHRILAYSDDLNYKSHC